MLSCSRTNLSNSTCMALISYIYLLNSDSGFSSELKPSFFNYIDANSITWYLYLVLLPLQALLQRPSLINSDSCHRSTCVRFKHSNSSLIPKIQIYLTHKVFSDSAIMRFFNSGSLPSLFFIGFATPTHIYNFTRKTKSRFFYSESVFRWNSHS